MNKGIATVNKCITTGNNKLLVTKASRQVARNYYWYSNNVIATSQRKLLATEASSLVTSSFSNKGTATINKCITTSIKQLIATKASPLLTSALLLVTRRY